MRTLTQSISDLNKSRWSEFFFQYDYRKSEGLLPGEQVIIELISPGVSGKRILDIGVGTGRTTEPLRSLSRDYVGIDYSPQMIHRARLRFPEADFRCVDARDLADFADGCFDLVWFSFNGLDCVSHEDRLQILSEIYRVTKPGGLFCFSSHNRDYRDLELITRVEGIVLTSNPLRLAFRAIRFGKSLYSAWRLKGREIHTPEFAILNDNAHDHRLLLYYITLRHQIDQLHFIGFGKIQAFGQEGERLEVNAPYDKGCWIYYLCEKSNGEPRAKIAGRP